MAKLTLLIFSRNDIDNALDLIKDMYKVSDEIVVMDGSDEIQHGYLIGQKEVRKLKKVAIYRVVALGYADPLRMYGLSKCNNEWVFLIDTDERLSGSFKNDLHLIIQKSWMPLP